MNKTLRILLGDQLNEQHSWFLAPDKAVVFLMMEILPETNYVRHHIQKIIGFFMAMRSFADSMQGKGHQFIYIKLDDPHNLQSFEENILQVLSNEPDFNKFEYLYPDEYRLDELFKQLSKKLSVPSAVFDTEHFLTKRNDLKDFFKGKKTYLMESFYRSMRKKYNILMDDTQPIGGQWNYDAENRKKYDHKIPIPERNLFQHNATEIYDMVRRFNIQTIGNINSERFEWCINRGEVLKLLDFFIHHCLKAFGTYEDAMQSGEAFLFHSQLSFAMNLKIINPLEVVEKAVAYWQENKDTISPAQIEGFVRQIIGWREYMRGVYWANMPDYEEQNYFEHRNPLPEFYWTGDTKMNCMKQSIGQALEKAYNHHIQRLMLNGSFALMANVHPDYVDEWYMGIYIDAIQWVEITNTRGMSQFADGGLVGTKPYLSSANYIDKMSDYCKHCFYDKKLRYGDKSCPFNSLYWNFYEKHREKLSKNPRIGMMYNVLDKMNLDEKEKIFRQAEYYLQNIDWL